MTARDMRYGRRGGGWSDGNGTNLNGPPCEVCGAPMLGGQKRRHGTCSPPLECCGQPHDVVGDVAIHVRDCLATKAARR